MNEKDKILERVKKLFALANSSNEHEAKLAAEKANELLVKYNLTMQQVSATDEKQYLETEIVGKTRLPNDEMQLLTVIAAHFFVKPILTRKMVEGKWCRAVLLVGEKGNVDVALFTYTFLIRTVREVFNGKKRAGEFGESARKSFVTGFCLGLDAQLRLARRKVETSMALTIVPDAYLQKWIREKHGRLGSAHVNAGSDSHAKASGFQAGKEVRIRRGLGEAATETNLRLGK